MIAAVETEKHIKNRIFGGFEAGFLGAIWRTSTFSPENPNVSAFTFPCFPSFALFRVISRSFAIILWRGGPLFRDSISSTSVTIGHNLIVSGLPITNLQILDRTRWHGGTSAKVIAF